MFLDGNSEISSRSGCTPRSQEERPIEGHLPRTESHSLSTMILPNRSAGRDQLLTKMDALYVLARLLIGLCV